MKNLKTIALLLLPFVLLAVFMTSFDPYSVPLPMLVVPFVLLGVGLYRLAKPFLSKVLRLAVGKARMMAGLITSVVMLVVLLQSLRQLSIRDFLLLFALLVCMTFYLRRF